MQPDRPEPTPLDTALRYASAGWPVFPCIPGEKVPATKHGLLDASTDPDRIASWWSRSPARNIGIATGAPGPDVADVDVRQDGSGFPAWNRLVREGIAGRPMAIVRTPSGGLHAYYRGTEQRNGRIPAEHIDFRSQGGYVVAPPSRVGGRPYAVVSHQASTETLDWSAVRKLLDPEVTRQAQRGPREGPADPARLARWVAQQAEGNRNDGLFWAACRALEAGDRTALRAIAEAAAETGLTTREIAATIRSAQRTTEPRPFLDREAS